MAADSNLSERARRAGLGLLTRRDGLRAIAEALRVDDVGVSDDDWNTSAASTTIAACPFDWERYKARHARASASSFLSEVGGDAAPPPPVRSAVSDAASVNAQKTSTVTGGTPTTDDPRVTARAIVHDAIRAVLGKPLDDDDAPLVDAGIDSLSTAELAAALGDGIRGLPGGGGDALPSTLVFDYPTPRALVAFIAAALPVTRAVVAIASNEDVGRESSNGGAASSNRRFLRGSGGASVVVAVGGETAAGDVSGAFYTLVPIRPRRRGERRSLRTLPVASLRPSHAFNPRPRRLSTPTDAFQLHPDIRSYGTTLSSRRRTARTSSEKAASAPRRTSQGPTATHRAPRSSRTSSSLPRPRPPPRSGWTRARRTGRRSR